ncbi:hypothetical protein HZH66_002430 [Vespula vulgaris]|uniref:Uncharacterized protein n=1 Tax=Vespula vulgaris TaxID=7454 RepID=A0A834KJL7_VESVU|nr:hypothetical protein HZH66_002430 [Vespula vulgaris]
MGTILKNGGRELKVEKSVGLGILLSIRKTLRACFVGVSNGRLDMAGEYFETTYVPEIKDAESKERERQLVQEGTAMWKHRKEEFLRQKHREQRELREILENYSPWGKPGGGAPCPATLRKKNVLLEPLEPVKSHMAGQKRSERVRIERSGDGGGGEREKQENGKAWFSIPFGQILDARPTSPIT